MKNVRGTLLRCARVLLRWTTAALFFGTVLAVGQAPPAPQAADRGQIVPLRVPAPSLKSSRFRLPLELPATVYLPPSYDSSTKRYPVLYFLPGFGSPQMEYVSGDVYQGFALHSSMDALIKAGKVKEMIVVLAEGCSFLSGSFYVNSPNGGNWEDFISRELVEHVDKRFRTLPAPASRAVAGNSMGGFGALYMAMRHPDVFGSCYAMSPGLAAPGGLKTHWSFSHPRVISRVRAIEAEIAKADPAEAKLRFVAWMNRLASGGEIPMLFAYAYACAFAPSAKDAFPFVELPYKGPEDKPELDPEIWKRYEEGFGNLESKVAMYGENLKKLKLLAVDVGLQDGHAWIPAGCEYFAKQLKEKGIPHKYSPYAGGHIDKFRERIEQHVFPEISKVLVHQSPGSPELTRAQESSEPKAITVTPAQFDALVGEYELMPGFMLKFWRDGEHFWIQATGQPAAEIFPTSPMRYYLKVVNAQVDFILGADGKATGVTLFEGGQKLPGKKVK